MHLHVHDMGYMFLMRDEKEGRKKQARSNKQQGKATQHTHVYERAQCTIMSLALKHLAVIIIVEMPF